MGSFPFIPTAEIYTGNPATVQDAYVTSPGVGNYLMPNGARVYPGSAVYWRDSGGHVVKLRYVRYNPVTAVSAVAGGPVYWIDTTLTQVSCNSADAVAGQNGIAGALLNINVTNGGGTSNWPWVYIQVAGYNSALLAAASTTGGDINYGGAAAFATTRVAAGAAAPIYKAFYIAYGPIVASKAPGVITCEDIGPA